MKKLWVEAIVMVIAIVFCFFGCANQQKFQQRTQAVTMNDILLSLDRVESLDMDIKKQMSLGKSMLFMRRGFQEQASQRMEKIGKDKKYFLMVEIIEKVEKILHGPKFKDWMALDENKKVFALEKEIQEQEKGVKESFQDIFNSLEKIKKYPDKIDEEGQMFVGNDLLKSKKHLIAIRQRFTLTEQKLIMSLVETIDQILQHPKYDFWRAQQKEKL
ncbi:MAG: hypothetical protein ABIG87_02920 [Patescibacteria group bacterium]